MTMARRLRDGAAGWLGDPWSWAPAVLLGIGLFVLLAVFVAADPAPGVTFSGSPYSDEGWNVVGARNLALLGRWSTDQWNLYLLQAPFSLLMAAGFAAFGVGIVQARLLCIGMVALATLGLGLGLRRAFGPFPAVLAALGLATSQLILYYGRLVYLEDLVVLALVLATLTLVRAERHVARWGFLAGIGLAVAIGAKTTAILPVAGLVAGVAIFGWVAERRFLIWAASATVVVVAAGVAWVIVLYLPNRAAIADDLLILAPVSLPATLGALRDQLLHLPRSDGLWLRNWPLLAGASVGLVLALAGPDRFRGVRGALLCAAIGWLLVGGGAYAVVTYQPNRYLLPLLPPLAIIVAAGASALAPLLRRHGRAWLLAVVAVSAAMGLSLPGLVTYASWMQHATYRLPLIQEEARTTVPADAASFGAFAPIVLMRARVVTIARTVGQQAHADLYATRGVRWFVAARGATVEPVATLHPTAWAARTAAYCAQWGGGAVCVYHVP